MALSEKYAELISAAQTAGVASLQVREQEGTLYVDGIAPTGAVKDNLWGIYDKIDPNYMTGDLVLNINVDAASTGGKAKVVTQSSSLNLRRGPGTDQEVIGHAGHHDYVTIVSQENPSWWLVRNADGTEGYAASQYLSIE